MYSIPNRSGNRLSRFRFPRAPASAARMCFAFRHLWAGMLGSTAAVGGVILRFKPKRRARYSLCPPLCGDSIRLLERKSASYDKAGQHKVVIQREGSHPIDDRVFSRRLDPDDVVIHYGNIAQRKSPEAVRRSEEHTSE